MGTRNEETRMTSMVELKDLARRLLLNTSELRDLILLELDYLPTDEVAKKVRKMLQRLGGEIRTALSQKYPFNIRLEIIRSVFMGVQKSRKRCRHGRTSIVT